jgi:hypothetical protein
MLSEPVLVVAKLARLFDSLGIRYVVGGSLASSIYGIPRATQDVDLVADIRLPHVDAITSSLAGEFYVDAEMIRDAIKRRASFNVVHLATMFKADVFILQGDSWSREEMARARTEQFDVPEGKVAVRFASPEDTLLHKMIWYKLGNQISDRQWGDIACQVNGGTKLLHERLSMKGEEGALFETGDIEELGIKVARSGGPNSWMSPTRWSSWRRSTPASIRRASARSSSCLSRFPASARSRLSRPRTLRRFSNG